MDPIYSMQREMLRRGYSQKTIITYVCCVKHFMKFCRKDLKRITKLDIKDYIDRYVDKNAAGNTINVNLNALKFLFKEVFDRKVTLKIKFSKIPKTLPIFLTKNEIKKLFEATKNEKHKLILELLYSAGLRVSEVLNLRKSSFDLDNNLGWVRKGKGNKDRPFIIANSIKNKLEEYIKNGCVDEESFLFIGNKGRILHVRSVQEIIRKYSKIAGIRKKVHPHTLRHSFATHLIEDGYDISSVQSLLGHNSAETTMMYVHMAKPKLIKIKSPYDGI